MDHSSTRSARSGQVRRGGWTRAAPLSASRTESMIAFGWGARADQRRTRSAGKVIQCGAPAGRLRAASAPGRRDGWGPMRGNDSGSAKTEAFDVLAEEMSRGHRGAGDPAGLVEDVVRRVGLAEL